MQLSLSAQLARAFTPARGDPVYTIDGAPVPELEREEWSWPDLAQYLGLPFGSSTIRGEIPMSPTFCDIALAAEAIAILEALDTRRLKVVGGRDA